MPRYTNPRRTWHYLNEFKVKAVQLSLLDDVQVKDVAAINGVRDQLFLILESIVSDTYFSENYYMTFSQKKFDTAIWKVVSSISRGRVMGYGEVARAAGYPRHARMVSKAMSRSSEPLPWYRVVRSDRTLAFEVGSEAYNKQRGLLEQEGVQFSNGKAVAVYSDDDKDLDELLWGPD